MIILSSGKLRSNNIAVRYGFILILCRYRISGINGRYTKFGLIKRDKRVIKAEATKINFI